ncbi:adenosylcobinamide-GDP ribazoletransferase [Ancylobacter amanitiformis]|uniref:Adenosylcobinamide-GDP ribazoletransferase n=1 Tax=Ancylobacter amanitiformis TaxID=217069 RepID=A0ABU0LMK8_9HYPH|nr:adenosylcobinamide-GDP ribazoletransferase [Ancylobacter amanitiformis]MDQ0509937.1 adenosylcobinamide-GDP ribazoletransferase [Ancylobacter amanitiformis]
MPIPVLGQGLGQILRDTVRDVPAALRFLSRLPIPPLPFERSADERRELGQMAPAFAVAGALIALVGALVFALADRLGLGSFLAATLALAALMIVTGGFHEDGLADTADALGGGTLARRLEIMKDSRIGSFGVLALVVSFALRAGALHALALHGVPAVAGALVAALSLSRVGALAMLAALPPARAEGLSRRAGRPAGAALAAGLAAALAIAAMAVVPSLGARALLGGLLLAAAGFFALVRLARAQFGGQTGDVAGAAVLVVEIAFLTGLLILSRHP